jgi:nucleoside-triphosphatase
MSDLQCRFKVEIWLGGIFINILIRGKPRSGKSTLIQKLVDLLKQEGKTLGGICTPEIRDRNRLGFEIMDMMTGERGILSHINQKEGPKIASYRVNLQDLDKIGVWGIKTALEKKVNVIIIDEIGKMELVSKGFQAIIWEALNYQKVLGTIGQITHPFVTKVYQRNDVKIFDLTIQNRELIFENLILSMQPDISF